MSLKILIIKLSAIGDIIHTLPVLAMVRDSLPDATISWVAEQRSAEILRGNPLIDNLIEVDTRSLRGPRVLERLAAGAVRPAKELRQNDFDIAIDFQGLLKSGMIAKLSRATQRWSFSSRDLREPASRVFYTDTLRVSRTAHVINQYLALAQAALEITRDSERVSFPIFTTSEDKNEAAALVRSAGNNFAILNPAGGWVTKLWHAEKYGRLADLIWENLGMSSIVVTGPSEASLAKQVLENSRSGKTIAAEPSLKGFYELAKKARIYVGGDTGPTHLAISAGAPVVGIFGPTEWWRNGSLNPDDVCVERLDIGCRVDCHRRTCSNWICMDISPETVFEAVRARLEKSAERDVGAALS
jgi:heptosyltransferase-1